MAIKDIAKLRLERDKAIKRGESQEAKRYQEMINATMSSESMKVADSKPNEQVRVDSIIDYLEKHGAVDNGQIVSRNELVSILAGKKVPYNTSIDVVDEIMFAIINTMRKNSGLGEIAELPVDAQIQDKFGELLSSPTDFEKKAMRDLNIMPPAKESADGSRFFEEGNESAE